ncbi:MAG: hypothetical protein PWQ32_65 [Thermococcaceae archaeon]|nr:hypothetical protein [Thermococcaceae archaeon]
MGSSLPTGGPWHVRQAVVSPGPSRGQWGPRYAIHAGRHLTDKEFRYLKRVIVTPAVYRRFTRLDPGFTYRHWAGVGPSTNPFGLAGTCVFIKQSGPPSHCDLRFTQPQAPLLPKLRGQFAEFPRLGFPRHALGFSPRGTSVGSRYGRGGSFPEGFSRAPGIGGTPLTGGHSRFHPVLAITALPGLIRLAGLVGRSAYPEASPSGLALPHLPPRYGNINPFPFRQHRVTGWLRTD